MGKGNTTPTEWRETVEMSEKPVVAAIQGYALGGGLETAMLCNYRIASETAKIGQPEVAIGIIPGAGGTQRVPRLAGVQAALDMIVGGEHYPSSAGKDLGILDDIYSDDSFLDAAIAYAEKVADVRPLPACAITTRNLQKPKKIPAFSTRCARRSHARPAINARPTLASKGSKPRSTCRLTMDLRRAQALQRAGRSRRSEVASLRLLHGTRSP